MKHSVPRETPFHKALGSLVKKGPIPRPQIPRAPIFGKPSSKAPTASLASKLKPLAIGKRNSNLPKKSKRPPRP